MKKLKVFLSLLLTCALVFACVGCGESNNDPNAPKLQTFSAGCSTSGGAFNVVGTGFNGKYSITAETTGGATANTALIETGECQFGVGGASSTLEAYEGVAEWTGGQKMVKSRVIAPMYEMSLTAFALSSSGIETWSDLEGKTVGLGSKGSGIDPVLRKLLDAMGINVTVHNDAWGTTVEALKDGTIDAVITQAAGAWPSLAETEATHEVNILPMTEEQVKIVCEMTPYYVQSYIPAGTYKANADKNILSCSMWAFFIASEDVDDEVVYELTKATWEHYDDMVTVYAGLAGGLKLENIPNMPFLFHDGAIKYYQEQGIQMAEVAPGFSPS
jgi:TRAP transporter TAXI family solute receptor